MKPLVIDFAPRRDLAQRLRWFAGGAGALLLVASTAIWLPTPPAEAGHMTEVERRSLPDAEEAQAVDAAVRLLNFPWPDALAALENACDEPQAVKLVSVTADTQRASLKVSGEARSVSDAQAMPARLRTQPAVAGAVLLSLEAQEGAHPLPVRFTLELHLRDPS